MIQRSIQSGRTFSSLGQLLSYAAPLCASMLACSADSITMGENLEQAQLSAPLPSTSRCRESTIIDADVVVENQEQLVELEGCTEVNGALTVLPFEAADLRPLYALTRVSGMVDLGGTSVIEVYDTRFRRKWLESLAGLESLESVGELRVSGLLANDVDALSRLHSLGWPGMLRFDSAPNLVDLQGLRQLEGIRSLLISDCSALESLEPLTLPRGMDSIVLASTPLTRLTSLELESLDDLTITKTGLVNLDAFSGLTKIAGELQLVDNLELENVDALDGLQFVGDLDIGGCPGLRRLPEFTELMRLDALGIYANDSLENVPTLPKLLSDAIEGDEYSGQRVGTLLLYRPSDIAIMYNPSLTSIKLSAGWFSAGRVAILNNDALARVEFTKQRSFEQLLLGGNPLLESVELGVLGTIDSLGLRANPLLDEGVFDSVRTFERSDEINF